MTSSSVPATATVVEFICLFTHDLKRKQKRWQDGVLKYHTFNKRVMVYDDRSHFIGDAHWQGGGNLEPGDEFELDRGSAIVQVSDCTGQREQDLTELLDKRAKEVEKRRSNVGARTPGSTAAVTHTPRNDQNAPHFQLRHRPLNDLVGGAPRIGRAVISPHSPYEVRKMAEGSVQQQDSPTADARPSKRRRQEESPPSKMGHARALFGTTLTLTPFSSSISSARSQTVPDKTTTRPGNMSTSKRTGLSGRSKHTDASLEPQPQSSNPEELEGCAPQQPAARRVFTQRASLRELLAGNEQNLNEDYPRMRESTPKHTSQTLKKARPQSTNAKDNVVSLSTQGVEQSEQRENTAQHPPRTDITRQKSGLNRRPTPHHSASGNVEKGDLCRSREQSTEANDDAFLKWLARSESAPLMKQTPVSPTDSHPSHPNKSKNGKSAVGRRTLEETDERIAQEPIRIDEDKQEQPSRNVAQTRPRTNAPKSNRVNEANTLEPHGTKRPLSVDKTSTTQEGASGPPPAKEPRTELRIRSRQRRGLLMMAQNKRGGRAASSGGPLPSSSGTVSDTYIAARPAGSPVPLPEESRIPHEDAKATDISPTAEDKETAVLLEAPGSDKETNTGPIGKSDPAVAIDILDEEPNEGLSSLQDSKDADPQIEDEDSTNVIYEGERASLTPPRRTNPGRLTRAKAAQVVPSDEEEEVTAVETTSKSDGLDNPDEFSSSDNEPVRKRKPKPKPKSQPEKCSGPRITKMSRKSVKSKEILGFNMPAEDLTPPEFSIREVSRPSVGASENTDKIAETASSGCRALPQLSRSITPATHPQEISPEPPSEDPPQNKTPKDEDQSQEDQPRIEQLLQQPQTKQPLRIPNPATRGKKAARKQDAAGLPPQALVQFDHLAPSHVASANPALKPNLVSNKSQSELPGFCKANGGAWSRHAEDLLGMARPSKALPRQ
ncbi:uncharacterized protein B0J16DRAFT_126735 [Fusarium flagelliforme]|uniref:uncharacterized protein n=1 Tax=Fusarium flagelliforme TaxID=2675880 RepID=UPI001E8E0E48|nr:uncharacterized protein B0J16DRAFT_126735 [Fusarium flagelliforme]KAH7185266.1 hypothetical protein B0J16DRAFT_126735 [Fusarium flagelliforme]